MQINQPNGYTRYSALPANPVFCSQKNKIKAADNFCRLAMREFPIYSNTRLEHYSSGIPATLYKLYCYSDSLISEIRGFCSQAKTPVEYYLRRLQTIRNLRVGNCSELADVTAMTFRLNGIKNADTYTLCAYNPASGVVRPLDHTVVGVNMTRPIPKPVNSNKEYFGLDRDAIIVDPWAGFTDSQRNASAAYKHNKTFKLHVEPEEYVIYTPSKNVELGRTFSKKDILYFRHMFPGLNKTKYSLWDKLLWRFMDKSKYECEQFPVAVKEAHKFNLKMKSSLTAQELHDLLNKPKDKKC